MKTDTSTRCPGATAARATPSSNAPSPSFDAPYTDIASPAERSTNERRDSPVPAGVGIPGSMSGSPEPARAAAARSPWEREKSLQQSAMGPQQVWKSGDVATSWRRAFWRIALYGDTSHDLIAAGRQLEANATRAAR